MMTVTFPITAPDELRIRSDGAGDTILIKDNGGDQICVETPGQFPREQCFIASGITRIRVFGNGGDDNVSYQLTSSLRSGVQREVRASLGDGDDTFRASLHRTIMLGRDLLLVGSDLTAGSRLSIVASGNDGRDTISVDAAHDVDIAATASLLVDIHGNHGDNDNVQFNYRGEMDGRIFLTAAGGEGNDRVAAQLTFDAGSTGKLAGISSGGTGTLTQPARVLGNDGDERGRFNGLTTEFDRGLTFIVRNNGAAEVFAQIDGGDGRDESRRTPNVPTPLNVERDITVT
jgi:hypothetical protein